MSDLLNIGASGIRAYRIALTTVAENTANVETPGYTRRQAQVKEVAAPRGLDPYSLATSSSGGVTVSAIARVWDDFKAADARLSSSDSTRAATRGEWLSAAETALPDGDRGVGAKLTAFFNAATVLSSNPDGALPREQMLATLDQAAAGIRSSADALARVTKGISDEAGATATAINDDLAALAAVNLALTRSTGGSNASASLLDDRDRLLDGLATKIGIDTRFDAKGAVTVSLSGNTGVPLLEDGAISLIAVERSTDGRLALSVRGDTAVSVAATGGSMAGLVDASNQVAGSRNALDAIAIDFQGKVNGWNAAGLTPGGTAGGALMEGTNAASLKLIAGLSGNAIAARGTDGTSNGNLLALGTMRGANGAEARMESLIGTNAQILATTRTEASATAARSDTAFGARDAISGVDMDREASDLLRFQQAYNGSAKVLQVAKETLNSILQLF